MIYSYDQVERCIRFAFETAMKRHSKTPWRGLSKSEKDQGMLGKVTLCGKTNVLTYVFDLWERVFKVAQDFPKILTNYTHVDAVCVHMIERPEVFDVIVTSNMFRDIITDLAAVTQGGMGLQQVEIVILMECQCSNQLEGLHQILQGKTKSIQWQQLELPILC